MKKKTTVIDMSKTEKAEVDWARVDATTEEEIEAQAREDGDSLKEWTPEMIARARAKKRPKKSLTIRMDADLIDRLKSEGPGYQSRLNAIVRSYYS